MFRIPISPTLRQPRRTVLGMWNNIITQLNILWEQDTLYVRTITEYGYLQWVKFERGLKPFNRHALNLSVLSFVFVVGAYIFFPSIANADPLQEQMHYDKETIDLIIASMQNESVVFGTLPEAKDASEPRRTYTIPLTAYTSEVAQTDDTPCITASGLDVCERNIENVVAANFLPIGTRVRIPELFGDRVFYVEDRMNARYYYKMDVWMRDIHDARLFGVKYATVEVF
jgi:3D (Asp-Asp-Asp) domain-containing protein